MALSDILFLQYKEQVEVLNLYMPVTIIRYLVQACIRPKAGTWNWDSRGVKKLGVLSEPLLNELHVSNPSIRACGYCGCWVAAMENGEYKAEECDI